MAEIFTPLTLAQINNQTGSAVTIINSNFTTIAALFADTLSLSGISPNQMLSTLDMNSHKIINLPYASSPSEPVTFGQLSTINNGTPLNFIVPASSLTGTILAGQVVTSSLTTIGTIATGVWQGTLIAGQYGGTGIANTGKTITLGGNLTLSGAFNTTFTISGTTNLTLPATTDTVVTLAAAQTLTNKSLSITQVVNTGLIFLIARSVNFNSATTDTSLTVMLPAGCTSYVVSNARIANASHDISTATFGLFTAASGGGTAIIASGTAITVTQTASTTNNNTMSVGATNANTESYTIASVPTLFFRVVAAEGAAATADVFVQISPY